MKFKGMIIFIISTSLLLGCKKDKVPTSIDNDIREMLAKPDSFSWYQLTDSLYEKSPGSGHNYPFLKTRFNSIAQMKLDSNGKVQQNAIFPEGSFIVKELYSDSTTIGRYAMLWKNSSSEFADSKGWVWGYINSDGSVAVSATLKGNSCINCHSQSGNIDYMLMNEYFP